MEILRSLNRNLGSSTYIDFSSSPIITTSEYRLSLSGYQTLETQKTLAIHKCGKFMFMYYYEMTITTNCWEEAPQCAVQIIFLNKFLPFEKKTKNKKRSKIPALYKRSSYCSL